MSRSETYFGPEQKRLFEKTVVIVGVGGTGNQVAQMLARQGLKHLMIIDRDTLEESNLERQMLYTKDDIDKPKVEAAKEKLCGLCNITASNKDLNNLNIDLLIPKSTDLIIDCTDNAETRLLINDHSMNHKIPWLYTGAIGVTGTLYFIDPKNTNRACYQCFQGQHYGETCAEAGVLNSTVSGVASMAVSIATHYLIKGDYPADLIRFDLESFEKLSIKVKKDDNCKACQKNYEYLSGEKTKLFIKYCEKGKYHTFLNKLLDLDEIEHKLEAIGVPKKDAISVRCEGVQVFKHGRIIIDAQSQEEAKKKYDTALGI